MKKKVTEGRAGKTRLELVLRTVSFVMSTDFFGT